MDIDLNLLGPYANLLNEGGNSKKQRAEPQASTSRRANFTALYKKQNIKFIQDADARRQGRQQKMEEHRKGRRSQIIAVGRKPTITEMTNDLNVMIQEDSSNEISELEGSDLSSLSISQQKKDNVSSEASNMDSLNGNETSGENNSKSMQIENSVDVQNAVNGKTTASKTGSKQVQSKKPTTVASQQSIRDSRRDQLQKWKKEKEAADMKAKLVQKQPFKVGAPIPAPVPTKPVKTTSTSSLVKSVNSTANASSGGSKSTISVTGTNKTASGAPSARGPTSSRVAPSTRGAQPAGISKTTSKPTVAPPVTKQPEVRRVTRAMTKTQTASAAVPPTQKMKTLNINERSATSRPGIAATKPSSVSTVPANKVTKPNSRTGVTASTSAVAKRGLAAPVSLKDKGKKVEAPSQSKLLSKKEKTPTPPSTKKKTSSSSQESSQTSIVLQEPPKEQVVKKKKAKPKPIDATYTDYNGRFSDACRKLGVLRTEWKNILDELNSEAVSEDILDEIHSALGKVKLLLESKLPQFGELLYAYLCKDEDATIILACDLEGWWDVAYIQVEAVYKIFDALTTLKNNQWRKSESLPPPKPSSRRKASEGEKLASDKSLCPPPQCSRPAKPKAQASGGLKAFLASKRKMLNSESDTVIATPASDEQMEVSSATVPAVIAKPVTPKVKQIQGLKPCPDQSLDIDGNGDSQSSNKMFEGGFFSISSPVATPTTTPQRRRKRESNISAVEPSASSVPAVLRTPNRLTRLSGVSSSSDASLRRASFTMLGVRRSMGTLGRLGVVPVFSEVSSETEADSV